MQDLDLIINRILSEERLKTEIVETPVPVLRYRCDAEKYSVEYNEAMETAIYTIDQTGGKIESNIPLKQRNYYVDSGYWKLC